MIKTLARLIPVIFLLTVTVNGMAQSQTPAKSKPAAAKKRAKPVADEEVKEEIPPPPPVEEGHPQSPGLPPLPKIDTVPPPNDELTKEIKKLIAITTGINTSKQVMKTALESQRKANSSMPDEFYVSMLEAVENGLVSNYLENLIVKIYRKKFTVEEIKEVNKFYETPVGRKMAAEASNLAQASITEGEKVGQYVAIKIIEGLMKEGKWK